MLVARQWTVLLFLGLSACSGPTDDLTAAPDGGAADALNSQDAAVMDVGQPDAGMADPLRVEVDSGRLQGSLQGEARAFLGVPYAAPPVGRLRWTPPAPAEAWPGVRSADRMSGECVQPLESTSSETKGDEDCLYLNVWTPQVAPQSDLPVMVFLHGGGNFLGSTSEPLGDATAIDSEAPLYDGARLAVRGDVVVVTLNYRLGALGFLSTPELDAELGRTSGNFGLLDQMAALSWVQRNIGAFGGDPNRVLLFGQSGAGRDVTSPLTQGLFAAVAIHSAPLGAPEAAPLRERAAALTQEVGCGPALDPLACLRGVDAHRLVSAEAARPLGLASAAFLPIVDGHVVVDQPRARVATGLAQPVPILMGTTAAEYSHRWEEVTAAAYPNWVRAFLRPSQVQPALAQYPLSRFSTPQEAFVTLMSDRNVTCPHRSFARTAARAGYDVWLYRFDQVLPESSRLGFGAYHTSDLVYLFQHLDDPRLGGTDADRAAQQWMMRAWSGFAADRDPSLELDVAWPPFDDADQPSLRLGAEPMLERFLKQQDCDFWDATN